MWGIKKNQNKQTKSNCNISGKILILICLKSLRLFCRCHLQVICYQEEIIRRLKKNCPTAKSCVSLYSPISSCAPLFLFSKSYCKIIIYSIFVCCPFFSGDYHSFVNYLLENSCFLVPKQNNSICFEHNFVPQLKVYRKLHRVFFNSVMSTLLGLKPSIASKNMFIQLTDIFLCVVYIKHIHDFSMTFDFSVSVASLLFETIKTSLFFQQDKEPISSLLQPVHSCHLKNASSIKSNYLPS